MKVWKIAGEILIVLVLILPAAACSSASIKTAMPIPQTSAARGDITTRLNSIGKIAVVTDARLSFPIGGKLTALNVKEGDKVARGDTLARLDTSGLEFSLAQARVTFNQTQLVQTQLQVGLNQARLGQTQGQAALDQARLSQVQANSSLAAAQFNLDKVQAVSDIKDGITSIQNQKTAAQVSLTQAQATGNDAGVSAMTQYIKDLQNSLLLQQQSLTRLLSGNEYTGTNALTYNILGQTYDRLTVEDASMKELAVEAAQKAVDLSGNGNWKKILERYSGYGRFANRPYK